jgi:hypothetical protein
VAPREIEPALIEELLLARDLASLDFRTVRAAAEERGAAARDASGCAICRGSFGPVLEQVELLRGRSFLTADRVRDGALELLHVSSSRHRDDLDSVPPMDAITIFEMLAKAEAFLLSSGDPRFAESGPGRRGWVSIEKRRRAGRHGRQLLRLLPSEPKAVARERRRIARHGGGWPSQLETRNPPELLLGEFRGGLAAAVPAEPSRPFSIVIYARPGATGTLSDLSGNQRWGLAQAVREITGALRLELDARGLPVSFSWRIVAGTGIEPFVELGAPRSTRVDDGPREWTAVLRSHIGIE